jgi:site-specific recombinase XerD
VPVNLDELNSPHSRERYAAVYRDFDGPLTAEGVRAYIASYRDNGAAPATCNVKLSALKFKARAESADPQIQALKSMPIRGVRMGTWLSREQVSELLARREGERLVDIRNRALLAMLCGAALRRAELVSLDCSHLQTLAGRLCITDLEGKGRRVRSMALNSWTAEHLEDWLSAAGVRTGRVWRRTYQGVVMEEALSADHVHAIVKAAGARINVPRLAPHDLRRTAAALSHRGGAKLQGVQAFLGHVNIQTTSRYLAAVDVLADPAGDYIKL